MRISYKLILIWLMGIVPMFSFTQGIELTTGGSIACTATATIEIHNGSFINNGTYTKGSETVTFSGNTAKTISGTSLSDFYNLTLTNTGGVSIAYNAKVTVSNTLTNTVGNAGLVLKSSATGTASLIESTAGISATVERYLADYVLISDHMFHLLSSPVAAQAIQTEFMDVGSAEITDFYSFDELQNLWINSRADGGGWNPSFENTFTVGKGYLVAYPDVETKNFAGTLNTYSSPLVLTCTNTANKGNGWNLLGNPFPSAIDWNSITQNMGIGMDDALYYYDNDAQNYKYYIQLSGETGAAIGGQRYIPAMQGFMVHAKAGEAGAKTVSIDNGDRSHLGQDVFYKSTNTAPGSLSLKVKGGNFEDEAYIHFNQAATTAFDGSFDAYKLRSYSDLVPMIYTLGADGSELAINGLPELDEQTVIPVLFESATEGQFSITANLSAMNNEQVYLEDKKLNKLQNLSVDPVYNFTAELNDNNKRFALRFSTVGVDELPGSSGPVIYSYEKTVYISATGDINCFFVIYSYEKTVYISGSGTTEGTVFIRNLTGQLVKRANLSGSTSVIELSALPSGVYVVSVETNDGVYSRKVILK